VRAGGEFGAVFELQAGSLVYLPKDVPHRFRIRGTTPAKFLGLGTPGGVEHLYREVGVPAPELSLPSPPTPEELGLACRYAEVWTGVAGAVPSRVTLSLQAQPRERRVLTRESHKRTVGESNSTRGTKEGR
jgi:hypothetical protein